MKSHPRISELLVKTKAFTDLDNPVVLTSGELGIYYINTEKTLQDGGKFKEYGGDPRGMIQHAVRIMHNNPDFKEVINILSDVAQDIFRETSRKAISGGQRRDWIFSGPIAHQLNIPHISLYKDGRIEAFAGKGYEYLSLKSLQNPEVLHIADLLTEGSSCYRIDDGEEKGWIPMIRQNSGEVKNLITVVTRLQGGEENLKAQNVNVHSFVSIDNNFLEKHSNNPQRALEYQESPQAWSEKYLSENGALALVGTFDPNGGKLDRAKEFLNRYQGVLETSGKIKELNSAVQEKYNKTLGELVG